VRTSVEILRAVTEVGGRLEPAGDKLRVLLPADCSPALKDSIRQHKGELLDLLETRTFHLTPDCAAWLHVARQILAGEFVGADRSTVESLTIGLRSIVHPLCQRALERLHATCHVRRHRN
jgi:hypothetical protein